MRKSWVGYVGLLLILLLSGCSGPDEKILGKWEDNLLGAVIYEFKKDGTVNIDADGEQIKGDFKTSGDTLTIEANGEKREAKYSIKDDVLTITPENEDPLEFAKVTKDKDNVAANTEVKDEEETKEKEETEVSKDYLYPPLELKKYESIVFENEAGKISMIGQAIFDETNDSGKTEKVSRVAFKVEGELKDTMRRTEFILSGVYTGGVQKDFMFDYQYDNKESKILVFKNLIGNEVDPSAELLRLDYGFLRTDVYISGVDRANIKDTLEMKNLLFDKPSNETVKIEGVEKQPMNTVSPNINMEDEKKKVTISDIIVNNSEVTVRAEVTYLTEDKPDTPFDEVAAFNLPDTGRSAVAQVKGKFFKGIPTALEMKFAFDKPLVIEEKMAEVYILGLGTQIDLSGGKEKISEDKRISTHSIIYDWEIHSNPVNAYNSSSIYGIKDTVGNELFGNTMVFKPEFYGSLDGYEEVYKNFDFTIPLGKQFKEFKVDLALLEGVLDFEKAEPGSNKELIVEFYETDVFPTLRHHVYNSKKPIQTVVFKEGDQPKEISIDVSEMSGLYVWLKSPLINSADEEKIEVYELIFKDGALVRK